MAGIPVEPSVLRWARETAGLDTRTAAARIGVTEARVISWEERDLPPTIGQLRAMADAYLRPLAALFMPAPPADDMKRGLPDLRRPEARTQIVSRALQQALMRAYRQRDALREVAEDLELPGSQTAAACTLDPQGDPGVLGEQLRAALDLDSDSKPMLLDPEALLGELARRAENLNVTVIEVQGVDVTEMRGFSLGEGPCPVVALNGADWPPGKIDALLHELAHVGFRSSGLCDLQLAGDRGLERMCGVVATAALLPARGFPRAVDSLPPGGLTAEAARAAGAEFGASGESVLLRMIELGRATQADYRRLKPAFDRASASCRAAGAGRSAEPGSPAWYQLKSRELGRRFIRQMVTAHGEHALSSRDLTELLEVPYDQVPALAGS